MAEQLGVPTTFEPGWANRVLEHARPYLVQWRQGEWVFDPEFKAGPWSVDALRLIVDELDRRNSEGATTVLARDRVGVEDGVNRDE